MNSPVMATTPTLLAPTSTDTRSSSRAPKARPKIPLSARNEKRDQSPSATAMSASGASQCRVGVGGADDMPRLYRAGRKMGRSSFVGQAFSLPKRWQAESLPHESDYR